MHFVLLLLSLNAILQHENSVSVISWESLSFVIHLLPAVSFESLLLC